MELSPYQRGRQSAGHHALRIVEANGEKVGMELLAGILDGFAVSLAALMPRRAVEQLVRNALGGIPVQRSAPKLVVDNESTGK